MDEKEYKIRISKILYYRIARGCRQLGVSRKNLILFLMSNTYDELCILHKPKRKEIIKETLDSYNQEKEKARKAQNSYEQKPGRSKDTILIPDTYISFRVSSFIDDYIEEWAYELEYDKNQIVIALIYKSIYVIEKLLINYQGTKEIEKDIILTEYTFQTDKKYFLDCVGISQKDFARISEAVVMVQLFERSSSKIRNRQDFGFYGDVKISKHKREPANHSNSEL